MPHNGRLFEMPPSQQIDCSDFSVCTHLRKKSNSADRTGIVSLRHSSERVALWVTAEVLRLRSHNSCELHSFINKSQPTVGSFECDGHPCRHLMVARPTAAVFLLFDVFFFQSIAESDAKSLSSMQRSAGEFCYSRTAEVCRLSSECCCTHTHTAQEPVLYFITVLSYSYCFPAPLTLKWLSPVNVNINTGLKDTNYADFSLHKCIQTVK